MLLFLTVKSCRIKANDYFLIFLTAPSYNKVIIEGNSIPFTELEDNNKLASDYLLSQNFADTFNPETEIHHTRGSGNEI